MQTPDRQTDGNGRTIFSRGHDTLRKYDSGYSLDGLDYYIFLAYTREVKVSWNPRPANCYLEC